MTPPPAHIPLRRIADHAIEVALLISVGIIFYFTLFPFDFAFSSWRQMVREVATKFEMRPTLAIADDFRNNILLFMPLGFCIAALAFGRMRLWRLLALATASGGAISTLVEVLQVFLGRRDSSISDVLANALGALAGAGVLGVAQWPLAYVGRRLVEWLRDRPALVAHLAAASRAALLAAWVSWLMVNTYVPIRLYHAGWMMFWGPTYPLNIGNEASADRPWEGTVRRVSLAARQATAREAARLAKGESPAAIFGADLLFDFDLTEMATGDNEGLQDRVDPSRRLRWQGSPAPALRPDGAHVGRAAFLTCQQMEDVTRRLVERNQFTIVVDAAAADLDQQGPARIAGLSLHPGARNLTIGQVKSSLIVRIRFPLTGANGADPELMVDDVFTDTLPKRIVAAYGGAVARVYAQGLPPREEEMHFVPELAVMWRLFPRCGWVFRMGTSAVPVYRVLYRVMVFGALGALLAVAALASPLRRRWRMLRFLLVGWILPAAIIDGIQTWITGQFDVRLAALSVVIGMAGSLLGWLWARRLLRQARRGAARGTGGATNGGARITAAGPAGNAPEAR